MVRKLRIEVPRRLYHTITGPVKNRRKVFRLYDDYLKFTRMLAQQKRKLAFYLYDYCLIPNRANLRIEWQDDKISRIMQGLSDDEVLTNVNELRSDPF